MRNSPQLAGWSSSRRLRDRRHLLASGVVALFEAEDPRGIAHRALKPGDCRPEPADGEPTTGEKTERTGRGRRVGLHGCNPILSSRRAMRSGREGSRIQEKLAGGAGILTRQPSHRLVTSHRPANGLTRRSGLTSEAIAPAAGKLASLAPCGRVEPLGPEAVPDPRSWPAPLAEAKVTEGGRHARAATVRRRATQC